jgi:hypothetical protein
MGLGVNSQAHLDRLQIHGSTKPEIGLGLRHKRPVVARESMEIPF